LADATKSIGRHARGSIGWSVPKPGRIKHAGPGDLILGPETERTERIQEIFVRAGIGCRLTNNIDGEMWIKLLCNCALNAISALGNARYGQIAENSHARKVMQRVVDEVLAVARATDVRLTTIEA